MRVFGYVLGKTVNSLEHNQASSLSVNRITTAYARYFRESFGIRWVN